MYIRTSRTHLNLSKSRIQLQRNRQKFSELVLSATDTKTVSIGYRLHRELLQIIIGVVAIRVDHASCPLLKIDCCTTRAPTRCDPLLFHLACVYTFAHSSRSIEEFISVLRSYGVTVVIDVHRFLGSQRNPQFDADALAASLTEHGIGYRHLEALRVVARTHKRTRQRMNGENDSFQAYADYALTDGFKRHSTSWSHSRKTIYRCSSVPRPVYWRCHWRIVAGWLLARGLDNIYDINRADEHELARFAEVSNECVTYLSVGWECHRVA